MRAQRLFAALFVVLATCLSSAKVINVSHEKTTEDDHPLQTAIDSAWPGDTIALQPGLYYEDIHSVRDGEEIAPIIISGPASAVLHGAGGETIGLINHDHIHLQGFSVNGMGDQDVETADPIQFRTHLIHVHGNRVRIMDYGSHTHRSGVAGFKAEGLTLAYAGSSCFKLSYFVTHSQITNNNILYCGQNPQACESNLGCGSGIDLGTTISHRMANVGGEIDRSAWNIARKNFLSGNGDACIVVHEGAEFNLLHGNSCLGSSNADGAGFMIRGDANVIRFNLVSGAEGAGIGLGGAKEASHEYGVFNQIYFNQLAGNQGGSILNGAVPQPAGLMCRNVVHTGHDDLVNMLTKDCPAYIDTAAENATTSDNGEDRSGVDDSESTPHLAIGGDKQDRYQCHEVPSPPVASSEVDPANPGNSPTLLLEDDGPNSHWSRYGIGNWVEFSVDSAAGAPTIEAVEITFYHGDSRVQLFEMYADGKKVLDDGASSGTTNDAELFMPDKPFTAKTIRIVGQGNQPTDPSKPFSMWNSLVRVRLCQSTPEGGQ